MVDTPTPNVTLFKKRGARRKFTRKRAETTPADSDSGTTSSEDDPGRPIKRHKNDVVVTASSTTQGVPQPDGATTLFPADRSRALDSTNDATRTNTLAELSAPQGEAVAYLSPVLDGTYRGLAKQASLFIPTSDKSKMHKVGPVRESKTVRTVTLLDMAPDVCKDYKQTGFCGFGDSCKFLHAREDYKYGWQLDKEWETATKGQKAPGGTIVASANRSKMAKDEVDYLDEKLLESIPFACFICKGPYQAPVITRCGHYFCEACALKRYRRDPGCAACSAGTNGVFNNAKKLQELLAKKQELAAQKRQKREDGGEVSDEGARE